MPAFVFLVVQWFAMTSLEWECIDNRHRLRTYWNAHLLKALVASKTGLGQELL